MGCRSGPGEMRRVEVELGRGRARAQGGRGRIGADDVGNVGRVKLWFVTG